MKLKYYMRGLGIGILLTTVLLYIGRTPNNLSDKEIMNRARKLGMVMEEKKEDNLENVLDSIDEDKEITPSGTVKEEADAMDDKSQESAADDKNNGNETKSEDAEDSNLKDNEQADPKSENTADAGVEIKETSDDTKKADTDSDSVKQSDDVSADLSKEENNENNIDNTDDIAVEDNLVTITIVEGMSSLKVADLLYENGIITDKVKFNDYIVDVGKAGLISIGTFSLPKNASFEEIVDKIT